ncbi:DNA-3-methyladenine glycosylase I [Dehalococcoidia bacterium]|nr:DNA-3-methyladenine glycosylase I [Dehalococcoidia bacterium]
MKSRCGWATNEGLIAYHDQDWGVPVHDDRKLFEMLILEGAQAGLSWNTVLQRRESYQRAFDGFEPRIVAEYGVEKVAELLQDTGVIRNRLKIASAIGNASAYLETQREFDSFNGYLWNFVGGEPLVGGWTDMAQIPASTRESLALSRGLRSRGFNFVGPTICYAYMQSVGLVNDHLVSCFRYTELIAGGGTGA